jgi:hypothetical protein
VLTEQNEMLISNTIWIRSTSKYFAWL